MASEKVTSTLNCLANSNTNTPDKSTILIIQKSIYYNDIKYV